VNILCETPANIRVLDQFISPEMLEMLNAGDVTGALQSIGMTAHTEDEITSAVTSSLQKDLENAIKTLDYKKSIEYSSDQIKAKAIEVCEQKIASIQSRISAINDRIKNAKEQTCPICYCDVENPAVTPCCQQLFCFSCLCESLKRVAACPLCRTRIEDLKSIQVVGNSEPTVAPIVNPNKKLNKRDAFVKFLKENPNAKVLMFSGYDATFNGMGTQLTEENIKYQTLNGSNARINKLLKEFGLGKWHTLFLNARNMGAGLNIDAATHVVLFHKMSQELEAQIIGRANRLGRTAPITVVHLLHDNEVTNTITHV
jgi:SNF2 family DNA or RNA helicase